MHIGAHVDLCAFVYNKFWRGKGVLGYDYLKYFYFKDIFRKMKSQDLGETFDSILYIFLN